MSAGILEELSDMMRQARERIESLESDNQRLRRLNRILIEGARE